MPYEIHEEKNYQRAARGVYDAALKSVEKLKGEILSSEPDGLRFEVKFNKTILGKVLGDRTQLTCAVRAEGDGSRVVVDAYPLDAIGRKLIFGARQGVTRAVVDLFLTHLENNLEPASPQ